MNFTPEENGFIDSCFSRSLLHFVRTPKNRDDIGDIREVVNYTNYHIGSIGVEGHRLMHSIFTKMGYCNDGKTTLKEKREEELRIAEKKSNEFKEKGKLAIKSIDAKMAELQELKDEYENHNVEFGKILKEKAEDAQRNFKEEMAVERKMSQDQLISKMNKSVKEMTSRELRVIAKEIGIKNYSHVSKAELLSAVEAEL